MKSGKKPCQRFLIKFLLFETLVYIAFLFPLKLVQKQKILHNIKTAHFLRNCGHGFAQRLFPQITSLLRELHQRFFELELEHCTLTLTENPLKTLILFHWYCNFNPPTRLTTYDIFGMHNVLAKISSFNLFFVWKF